jgi:hypothetical protein
MAFNISDFKSNIEKTGVLQTNKYDVLVSLPKAFGNLNIRSADGSTTSMVNEGIKDLTYRCVNASLPGIALRTNDINRFGIGITEKMPFSAGYTDVSLTFLMDKSGAAYKFWYTWLNYIFGTNGEETNSNIFGSLNTLNNRRSFYTAEYKDNYAGTIQIKVYDTSGNVSLVTTLLKAYPTSMNDVSLNWSDNNNLIKLTITITFREWVLGDSQQAVTLNN